MSEKEKTEAEKIWRFLLQRFSREEKHSKFSIKKAFVGKDEWQRFGMNGPVVTSLFEKKTRRVFIEDGCFSVVHEDEPFKVVRAQIDASDEDILKALVKGAASGDVKCWTFSAPFIRKGESWEELLVKADLEDIEEDEDEEEKREDAE